MKKIEDFNQVCPLLERMSDKAMMDRHWKRIEDITGHKFDVESEGFQLRHVMDAPLLEHLEDIEVRGSVTARYTHAARIKQDGQHRGTPLSHTTYIHTYVHTCACLLYVLVLQEVVQPIATACILMLYGPVPDSYTDIFVCVSVSGRLHCSSEGKGH